MLRFLAAITIVISAGLTITKPVAAQAKPDTLVKGAKPDTVTVIKYNYGQGRAQPPKTKPETTTVTILHRSVPRAPTAQAKEQKYKCTRKSTKTGTDATYVHARSESEAIEKAKNLPAKAAGDTYVCILSK
jgi:hypothetical protein